MEQNHKPTFPERQQEVAKIAEELATLAGSLSAWASFLKDEAARMAEAGRKFENRIQRNSTKA